MTDPALKNTLDSLISNAQHLIQQGRFADAETMLKQACDNKLPNAQVHQKLGVSTALQGKRQEAITYFRKAIELDENCSLAYNGIALALSEECQLDEAEQYSKKGLETDPQCLPLYSTHAKILKAKNHLEEAEKTLKKGLQLYPQELMLWTNLGAISGELQNKEAAIHAFEQALKLQPLNMEFHEFLAEHKSYSDANDPHICTMEALLSDGNIQDRNAANLNFALAKAYEKIKDYETAFFYYDSANTLVRKMMSYDHRKTLAFSDAAKKVFTPDFFELHKESGLKDETPIFIIGMPRSGTSLAEQILASHSDVFGAGELEILSNLHANHVRLHSENTEQDNLNLSPEDVHNLAKNYLSAIKQYAPNNRRIIDKMPLNFQYTGLIQILFPNASIIHCVRDKKDVMLSNFKCNFKGNLPFAFDLDDIAAYYSAYKDFMDSWETAMPQKIFTLRYEDLIENQKSTTEALLDYCNLKWQDSCLEFYKTKRSVTTASAGQVQKPLYKSAVRYWKNFEAWLPENFS